MIVKNKYFSLEQEKNFHNGEKKVSKNEKILYLCTDKGEMKFLFENEDCIIVFWAKDSEVKFLEEVEEEFSEEKAKIIKCITEEEYITV